MNAVVAIVRANLKRLLSERSNIFFLVVLPLLIVFSLGVAIGGQAGDYKVGVVDDHPDDLSRSVLARMESIKGVTIVEVDDASRLRDDVARRSLDAGWVVGQDDGATTFRWLSPGTAGVPQLRTVFGNAVELKPTKLPAMTVPITKGVANYKDLKLKLAGTECAFSGSFDLVDLSMKLDTGVPLKLLGKKVSKELEKVREYVSPDLVVPIEIRGAWNKPKIGIGDGFVEKLATGSVFAVASPIGPDLSRCKLGHSKSP